MERQTKIAHLSLLLGVALLTFFSSVLVVTAIFFMIGLQITSINFFIPLIFTLLVYYMLLKKYFPDKFNFIFLWSFFGVLSTSILLSFICSFFYDISVDGQGYHQEIIIQLAQGWNPIKDKPIETLGAIWINHYAKGSETIAAVIYYVTGNIEIGKVTNMFYIISTFLISFSAFMNIFKKQIVLVILLSLLVAFNPISIYQTLSYYIDGQLASMIMITAMLSILLFKDVPKKIVFVAMVANIIIVTNIKFTAIVYTVILYSILFVILLIKKKYVKLKPFVITCISGFILGILIVGYNPYVTNLINQGNPFYPLAGKNAIDIITEQTPKNLNEKNTVEKFVISFFVKSENTLSNQTTNGKWPFMVSNDELKAFSIPDIRMGGFGPLFGGILILSSIIFIMSLVLDMKKTLTASFLIVVLLFISLINPGSWWARYVPQIWLIPIIISSLGFIVSHRRLVTYLCWIVIFCSLVNISIISGSYIYSQYQTNKVVKNELLLLKEAQVVEVDFKHTYSNRIRFQNMGIHYIEVPDPKCSNALYVRNSQTIACMKQ